MQIFFFLSTYPTKNTGQVRGKANKHFFNDGLTWVGGNCSIYTIVTPSPGEDGSVLSISLLPLHLDRRELELFYLYPSYQELEHFSNPFSSENTIFPLCSNVRNNISEKKTKNSYLPTKPKQYRVGIE